MLASKANGDAHRLNLSFASDIVELVVFTTDELFLQTLREAVGSSRRLWHVPSAAQVSDLLLAGQVGILVLDVLAWTGDPAVFVRQLKRQHPELVLVVAGSREAETALANLISGGMIYRFLHKPVSPGRAKLFADAAVKKFAEQRRRMPPTPHIDRSRRRQILMASGIAAASCAAAAIAFWALHRSTLTATPSTTAPPAAAPSAAAPPNAMPPTAAIGGPRGGVPTPAGQGGIDTIRESNAAGKRIAAANAQPTKAPQPAKPVQRGKEDSPVPAAEERLRRLLQLAEERIKKGSLIEPHDDCARFYVQQALAIDPNGNATQAAKQTLAIALLTEGRGAVDHHDFVRAAQLLDAATGIAAPVNIDNARQLLETARQQAAADARRAADAKQDAAAHAPQQESLPAAAPALATAPRATTPAPSPTPAPASPPATPDVIPAHELTLLKSVNPTYPLAAAKAEREGWVELDFTVLENGAVKDIAVHAADPPGLFDAAAIAALAQWRYQPVLKDSKPIAQRARIRIRFTLRQ